ncbi:MAG: hypothetical protein U9O78_04795 [Patescibacteria group bacterium]|nr:hypothetical protein [Patescibacteria group bacterium]
MSFKNWRKKGLVKKQEIPDNLKKEVGKMSEHFSDILEQHSKNSKTKAEKNKKILKI